MVEKMYEAMKFVCLEHKGLFTVNTRDWSVESSTPSRVFCFIFLNTSSQTALNVRVSNYGIANNLFLYSETCIKWTPLGSSLVCA